MPVSRRLLLFALAAAGGLGHLGRASAEDNAAAGVIQRLYAALLAVMKSGRQLAFAQRYDRLAPTIRTTFDLPLMSRLAVGPGWAKLSADQQQRISDAFARYTIATYANRFDDFGGERFEVNPTPTPNPNGAIVQSDIVKSTGEKVAINYLMHKAPDGTWKAMDVYLSGSISELASRRSEFAAVLQRDGADGLVRLLESRAAPQHSG